MVAETRPRKHRRLHRAAVAICVVMFAHVGAFIALGTWRAPPRPPDSTEAAIPVSLVPPVALKRTPPADRRPDKPPPPPAGHSQVASAGPPVAPPAAAPSVTPSVTASAPPSVGQGDSRGSPPGPSSGLSGVLRHSLIGCANADAGRLSAAERAACGERLGRGAASTPYLSAIPADKRAYFDVVSANQADFLSGKDPGHGPAIACKLRFGGGHVTPNIPPHALKLGKFCFIEPPKGPLTLEVDIPSPDQPSGGAHAP